MVGVGGDRSDRRLLVVSHPSVRPVNQSVYELLAGNGWDVTLVLPSTWRDEYSHGRFRPTPLPGLAGRIVPVPILLPGRPQRHIYVARVRAMVRRVSPIAAFLEQEPFSIPALQWGIALGNTGVPFGVQADENLDRRLPAPARFIRSKVLPRATFVAARSPAAAQLVRKWGMTGAVGLVPHAVPTWPTYPRTQERLFTIGYAGRLVEEKGLRDLIAAIRRLGPGTRLILAGDGPLRGWLEAQDVDGTELLIRSDVRHEDMPRVYAEMDVLVLPSRTTPTWAEQFGRALAEALWCGVPVLGSDSGEIPWVIRTTGGGHVFREGDDRELAVLLARLRDDPDERRRLADAGGVAVRRLFSVEGCARALEEQLLDAIASSSQAGPRLPGDRKQV
jgi:glycosyltransferase involved in cell wall biosynthesis